MGAGESVYVQDQERFVRDNVEQFKKVLPEHYSKSQIKGKLRQLYAKTDNHNDNKHSYISNYEWNKARAAVIPKYSSTDEMKGFRRYR
jgi:hypothetical protein